MAKPRKVQVVKTPEPSPSVTPEILATPEAVQQPPVNQVVPTPDPAPAPVPPPVAPKAVITTNVVIPAVVHPAPDEAPGEWKEKKIMITGDLPAHTAPKKVHGNGLKGMMTLTNLEKYQAEAFARNEAGNG